MIVHWSPDDNDSTKTACNELVGYLLAETQDEVTCKASDVDCKACREFLEDAEEHANQFLEEETNG